MTSTVLRCEDNMNTTLRETDIAPENSWLEEEISLWEGLFSGAMWILRSVDWKDLNDVYNFIYHSDFHD